MAYISTGVEYALHCLLYLIPVGDRVSANAGDLAALQGVPAEFLAKIFTKLSAAGLVAATEGAQGGFALAKPAAEIRFLDVVEAIDGRKPLFECREIRERCAVFGRKAPGWATSGTCSIHKVMLRAEERMREELAGQSLAMLAGDVGRKAPARFGIQVEKWLEQRG